MRSLGVVQMESNEGIPSLSSLNQWCQPTLLQMAAIMPHFLTRSMTTEGHPVEMPSQSFGLPPDPPARIKFKRLDKTAKHIMQVCICSLLYVLEKLVSLCDNILSLPLLCRS